jgi:hypothetical protein
MFLTSISAEDQILFFYLLVFMVLQGSHLVFLVARVYGLVNPVDLFYEQIYDVVDFVAYLLYFPIVLHANDSLFQLRF